MPTPKGGDNKKGVDTTDESGKKAVNPRDALIEGFAAKVSERHRTEHEEHEAEKAQNPAKVEPKPVTAEVTDDTADSSVEDTSSTDAGVGDELEVDHPLLGLLIIEDGKAKVKVKVNGEERFITAEAALAGIQKHESANTRMWEVSQAQKDVKAREERLQAREAEIAAREQKLKTPPSGTDVGDPDLKVRAKKVAATLLTGTEDEVAATVEELLVAPRQAQAPTVDVKKEVVQAVKQVRQQEATVEALAKFETDFPDIKTDPRLYAVADGISDVVAAEHPDWSMTQVLTETGNRTRQWLEELKGPKPADPPTITRQTRKDNLRPMPQARSATQVKPQPPKPESAADVVASIRKSRGQA